MADTTTPEPATPPPPPPVKSRRHRLRRVLKYLVVLLILMVVAARIAAPWAVRNYVNHVLNAGQLFSGQIGDVHIHVYKGAYEIDTVRITKRLGDVPVPLFATQRLQLEVEWPALLHGKIVGRVVMDKPELNFVDAPNDSDSQTGAGGPWLQILTDLFPFKINSVLIHDGAVHFRTYRSAQPVDVFLSKVQASVNDLTNVRNNLNPLVTTVEANGLAMDQADFQFRMKLNPFSYEPTFQMAVKLIGLEVTKINDLAKTYGGFDFKDGLFDFVLEADAKEGQVDGFARPLFRNLRVFDLSDLKNDDPLSAFWSALVGGAMEVLKNPQRNQFGTQVPFSASLENPQIDFFTAIGNVLRNAFIRAYLPTFWSQNDRPMNFQFGPPKLTDPTSVGDTH